MDLSKAIEANSDQMNAIDLAVPEVVTITEVRPGDKDQPVWIVTAEHPGKPWKPSKTGLRMLVHAWGTTDGTQYVDRRVELFNDLSVTWAGEAVGGIRVSAVSHIDKPTKVTLPVSRGKRKTYTIQPLPTEPVAERIQSNAVEADMRRDADNTEDVDVLRELWAEARDAGVSQDTLNYIATKAKNAKEATT